MNTNLSVPAPVDCFAISNPSVHVTTSVKEISDGEIHLPEVSVTKKILHPE